MSNVTDIQQAKWQRHADEQELKNVDAKIAEVEKAMVFLLHRRVELVKRTAHSNNQHPEEIA